MDTKRKLNVYETSKRSSNVPPSDNYLFKVNNRNTRTKLTIKTPERCQASFWCRYCYLWIYFTPCSGVFIVKFHFIAMFLFIFVVSSILQWMLQPSRHLPVLSEQWKYWNYVWNIFKVKASVRYFSLFLKDMYFFLISNEVHWKEI